MKEKILLIEDDKPTIELYEEAFKMAGFEIETLKFGYKAIEFLKEIREGKKPKPDLILLDLILPDMNGISVLEEAKKYPETKDLVIFALTNYSDPELNKELLKLGIDRILSKTDYTPLELIKIVREAIK
jgi:CheY-like chemotaxis protein